jgi:putative nucleotidyltransferase with HDIG domain
LLARSRWEELKILSVEAIGRIGGGDARDFLERSEFGAEASAGPVRRFWKPWEEKRVTTMTEITHLDAQRVAMLLTASIKSVTFYPQAHPAVRQPLQELSGILDMMLHRKPEIHFGVVEGVFFLEGHLFVTPNSSVAELADRLTGKGIEALTLYPGVNQEDLFRFASLLARRDVTAEILPEEMERSGIRTIRLGIDQPVYGDASDEEGSAPSKTYLDALNAVRGTMSEIENGRIPDSDRINAVVDDMVSLTIKDHTTLLGLAMIKDYDNYTFNHSVNVGILSLALAAFQRMPRDFLRDTNTAGLLHDIGKTGIDKKILNKPGKLSSDEYEVMKTHAEKGAEIIGGMKNISPRVGEAVLGHHIRHNRTGYPEWAREGSSAKWPRLSLSPTAMTPLQPSVPTVCRCFPKRRST